MKKHILNTIAALAVTTTLTQPVFAESDMSNVLARSPAGLLSEHHLLSAAFDGGSFAEAALLDERAMRETRGELWPFIVSVVGLDLALSSYFWGVYVPSVSGGNGCLACTNDAITAHK